MNIYILSDSQAAIKALGKHQITSKLVWDCHQSLIQLAKHNRVQLICVPKVSNAEFFDEQKDYNVP
jgi:hypothetical protein